MSAAASPRLGCLPVAVHELGRETCAPSENGRERADPVGVTGGSKGSTSAARTLRGYALCPARK